jgi:hypothetical protein
MHMGYCPVVYTSHSELPPHKCTAFLQGLHPCDGCREGCYQCAGKDIDPEDATLAWDLGEIYGLANPTRLPSPTTTSLSRTIIMRPRLGTITKLSIGDAERAQGLPAGYTALPTEQSACYKGNVQLKHRFRCVGNTLPGMVASPLYPGHGIVDLCHVLQIN